MLKRAVLPLARPRYLQRPPRIASSISHVRFYGKDDRLKRNGGDYRIPETADTPDWKKTERWVTSDAGSDQPRDPLRRVPAAPVNSSSKAESPRTDESPEDGQDPHVAEQREHQSVEGDARSSRGPEPTQSGEVEEPEGVQRPLPDLTRGIPSTLDAELRQAHARQSASRSSLNITEDPAEPVSSDEGRDPGAGDGGLPRTEYVSSSDQKKNTAFRFMYLLLGLGGSLYAVYLGRNWSNEEEEKKHPDAPSGWGLGLFYNRVKARLGSTMSYYRDPVSTKLLPDEEADPNLRFPFTLVLSLEDLLIHSEWTRERGWRIAKRPGVDYFLRYLGAYYEIVLFTSQPMATAEQVLRKLDPYQTIRWPLFREATLYKDGGYVKDLSYLNRDLKRVLVIDTDPHHVKNQPENAIVLPKWTGDPKDQTLVQLIPFLEYLATMGFDDVRTVLKSFEGTYIPAEFARREKILREKFEAEEAEKRKKRPKKNVSGLASIFGVKSHSPDGMPSTEEALSEGKMYWDLVRERGQRQYMEFEKKIREEGEKWLKEREEEEKRYQEEAMKSMKSGVFGWFGGSGGEQKK